MNQEYEPTRISTEESKPGTLNSYSQTCHHLIYMSIYNFNCLQVLTFFPCTQLCTLETRMLFRNVTGVQNVHI